MPSHKQNMVEAVVTVGDLGSSDTTTVQASFPASPIYLGDLTDDGVIEQGQALLLDGEVNDAGHTFGLFERDYAEAPDFGDVEQGGAGLPASAWVPNPVSPGPGSMNPADQADPPDGFGQTPNDQWGSGVGSQLNPAESSAAQSTMTLGDYVMGKAPSP